MSVETEERFEIRLDTLEALFVDSATGGISIFTTLALPEEDQGANKELIDNFHYSFKETLSQEEMDYHVNNIQEIRKKVLEDETLMMILEDRINDISSKIATNLISDEENLMVTGEFDPKED